MNKFDPLVRDFASTLSIALVSVLAAVAVFGLLALLARPKRKRRKTVVRYYEDDEDAPPYEKRGHRREKAVYVQPHSRRDRLYLQRGFGDRRGRLYSAGDLRGDAA